MKCSIRNVVCALAAAGAIILAAIVCLFLRTSDDGQEELTPPVPRDAIVAVYGPQYSGEGIAILRGDDIFIWTMASILEYREEPRPGASSIVVDSSAWVQRKGTKMYLADVIAHGGHDGPALLRVLPSEPRGTGKKRHHFMCSSAAFAVGYVPPWRAPALAVSASGKLYEGAYLEKSYRIGGFHYDVLHTDAPDLLPGGSVFHADGQCIGLLVERSSPNGFLVLPVRELERWAQESRVEWAINPALPVEIPGTK